MHTHQIHEFSFPYIFDNIVLDLTRDLHVGVASLLAEDSQENICVEVSF